MWQQIVDLLNKLSTGKKLIILGLVLVAIIVGYFFSIYVPKQQTIKTLEDQLSKIEVDLTEKKAIADNLPKFQEEVARLDEELQKQLKKLPNKAEIPKIL